MLVADQPGEPIILYLKRRDSDMGFMQCVLQSSVRSVACRAAGSTTDCSSDYEPRPRRRARLSMRNNDTQLSPIIYPDCNVGITVCSQFTVEKHNIDRAISTGVVSACKQHLIRFSAHDLPSFLSFFVGLGTAPFHLYRIVSFA